MTFGEADDKSFMHKVGRDEKTSFAIMNRALAARRQLHRYRRRLRTGRPVRARGRRVDGARRRRRDKIVLATKFRFRMGDGRTRRARRATASCGASRTASAGSAPIASTSIRSTCRTSTTPEEETLRALDDLVRAGKVLYLGAEQLRGLPADRQPWIAKSEHLASVRHAADAVQPRRPRPRARARPALPAHRPRHPSVVAARRRLLVSGKYRRDKPPPAARGSRKKERFARYDNDRGWRIARRRLARREGDGATPRRSRSRGCSRKPAVDVGDLRRAHPSTQLDDNLKAAELKLDAVHRARAELDDQRDRFIPEYPVPVYETIQGRW